MSIPFSMLDCFNGIAGYLSKCFPEYLINKNCGEVSWSIRMFKESAIYNIEILGDESGVVRAGFKFGEFLAFPHERLYSSDALFYSDLNRFVARNNSLSDECVRRFENLKSLAGSDVTISFLLMRVADLEMRLLELKK